MCVLSSQLFPLAARNMELGLQRSWKRQSRCLDFQLEFRERSPSKHRFYAETFGPFHALPLDPDDSRMWWKLLDLKADDFFDWEIRNVDNFASTFCGLIASSPYFKQVNLTQREALVDLVKAPAHVFGSIADEFASRMKGKTQHKHFLVSVNGYQLGIFRYGKEVYAIENRCPHQNGPLGLGDIEEIEGRVCVTCPWHHWRFELETGKTWQPYRTDKNSATVFPVVTINEKLFIGFDQYNPTVFCDTEF